MRLAALPLLVAALLGLTARSHRRRDELVYLAGSLPLVFLLGLWQWATYGSPFVTGYQVVGAGPVGITGKAESPGRIGLWITINQE